MGTRRLIGMLVVLLAADPAHATPERPVGGMGAQVVSDFAAAVAHGRNAYVDLFDFAAVGVQEILLHRYDLDGRLILTAEERARFQQEDGTPYPAERERRNVGNFYAILAQRTVGTGRGCTATEPRTRYGKLLGRPYGAFHAGTPAMYERLRALANAWLARGGVVRIACAGGQGGLALVWTKKDNFRGYDLITIYDD
jgi:hypothetical protein